MALRDQSKTTPRASTEAFDEEWRRAQSEMRVLGAQVAGITDELRELARRESVLARTEIRENAGLAARSAAYGGSAAMLSLYVLGFLGLALTFGLAEWMPFWIAALLTAGVFGGLAVAVGSMAKSRFDQFNLKPRRTLRSLREDVQWARAQMRRSAQ